MVTPEMFTRGMNKLAQRWKEINKQGLEDRYYSAIGNIPESAFKEIIYNFLDSSLKMPLPKDFNEAAKEWRNRFYRENGFYYGTDNIDRSKETVEKISDDYLNKMLNDEKVSSLIDLVMKQKNK